MARSKGPCTSTVEAPISWRPNEPPADHQCCGSEDHEKPNADGKAELHFCGCGYEWNSGGEIVKRPEPYLKAVTPG